MADQLLDLPHIGLLQNRDLYILLAVQKEIKMNIKKLQLIPEVIDAINEELEYVSTLSDIGRADAEDYGVEGQLLALKVYTDLAIEAWVNNSGPDQSLDVLRKCAAIAIRALVTHGCPRRVKKAPFQPYESLDLDERNDPTMDNFLNLPGDSGL